MQILQQLAQRYMDWFKQSYIMVQAPGRINIIGEHTDYNEGWVLPAAIDKYIYFALGNNSDIRQVEIYSPNFDETARFSIDAKDFESIPSWGKYLQAVIMELQSRNYNISGVNGIVNGDIPTGAGLSSSAALCSGFIFGLAHLNQLNISRLEMALIAQATEHRVGLNCGLMDPYASLHGKANHAIFLDCQNNESNYFPLDLKSYSLVLIDSKVKHELAADSGYNERRTACERVVALIQQSQPNVRSLRDIDYQTLRAFQSQIQPKDYQRAKYVLDENQRVHQAIAALEQGRLATLGQLLYQSHYGMQYDYEITVPEIDLLVDLTKPYSGVLGARMVGGGFGGCTINLIHNDQKSAILERITEAYQAATQLSPIVYDFNIGDGVKLL